MTVFRSLSAEIFGPAKKDKLPYLVQNAVRFLKFPCVCDTILFVKVRFQQFKNLY